MFWFLIYIRKPGPYRLNGIPVCLSTANCELSCQSWTWGTTHVHPWIAYWSCSRCIPYLDVRSRASLLNLVSYRCLVNNSLATNTIPARMFEDAILKTSREAFKAFKMRKHWWASWFSLLVISVIKTINRPFFGFVDTLGLLVFIACSLKILRWFIS